MLRWLEELETKHAEFTRCILSFEAMTSAWKALSQKDQRENYAAFARRQAWIYQNLLDDTRELYVEKGETRFVSPEGNLVDAVRAFRQNELGWLLELAGDSEMPNVRSQVSLCRFSHIARSVIPSQSDAGPIPGIAPTA
jgi:23S rRNA A1618 N6-methylase RlmF